MFNKHESGKDVARLQERDHGAALDCTADHKLLVLKMEI
jgi:hypothetical protein